MPSPSNTRPLRHRPLTPGQRRTEVRRDGDRLRAPPLPDSDKQPQLTIVERVTVAFLDRYLKGITAGSARMRAAAAAVPGTADLISDP